MPRYFFHLYDDEQTLDEEGREYPDLEAALKEGLHEARTVAGFVVINTGQVTLSHRIEIALESGQVLATISFGDALSIRP